MDCPVERVLFLDFDGVPHPSVIEVEPRWMRAIGLDLFGWLPSLVHALQPHPDVGAVVHSTWRRTRTDDELRLRLGGLGARMLGSTPPGKSFESIQQWLRANPAVTSYRILDDAVEEYPRPLPAELIVCDPKAGVTSEGVAAALRLWLTN